MQYTQLLRDTCKVTLSMLPQLHTCIILASEYPSHIMRGIPQDEADDTSRTKRVVYQEEAAAKEMRKKADFGLNMLMRFPQDLSGISLFEHQVAFRQRVIAASDHKVCSYLNVEVGDKHQQALISRDAAMIIQHNIMREVGASGNTERLAQRKLDALSSVKSHSCCINDPKRMDRLRSKLTLAKSLEAVKRIEDEDAATNKKQEEAKLVSFLGDYVEMYSAIKKDEKAPKKLTKKHINTILLLCYDTRTSGKKEVE